MSKNKKIIYSILTEISNGNNDFNWYDYEIEKQEFADIIEMMAEDGLINKKVNVNRGGKGNKTLTIYIRNAKITAKGETYLQENSSLKKTYNGLKEIRDWLPL